MTAAVINIVEKPWERVAVDGQPHSHGLPTYLDEFLFVWTLCVSWCCPQFMKSVYLLYHMLFSFSILLEIEEIVSCRKFEVEQSEHIKIKLCSCMIMFRMTIRKGVEFKEFYAYQRPATNVLMFCKYP